LVRPSKTGPAFVLNSVCVHQGRFPTMDEVKAFVAYEKEKMRVETENHNSRS